MGGSEHLRKDALSERNDGKQEGREKTWEKRNKDSPGKWRKSSLRGCSAEKIVFRFKSRLGREKKRGVTAKGGLDRTISGTLGVKNRKSDRVRI